jgi:hypothetical protein
MDLPKGMSARRLVDVGATQLPPMDPQVGRDETERRKAVYASLAGDGGGAGAAAGATAAAAQRRYHFAENSGFWVINCANRDFPTKCRAPNIRLLRFFGGASMTKEQASAAADGYIRRLMADCRVKTIPIKVPANEPFLIPASEAAALDPVHTHAKVARCVQRHKATMEYRAAEMKLRMTTNTAVEFNSSSYARHKEYLRQARGDGVLPPRAALPDGAAEAALQAAAAAAAEAAARAAAEAHETAPPPVVPPSELPSHWQHRHGPGGAGGPAGPGGPLTADYEEYPTHEWPADLGTRQGDFAVVSVMDDDDTAADSLSFPEAAGREPLMVVFGGVHKTEDDGKDYAESYLEAWCRDIDLYVVEVQEWLWPTELDPDRVASKARTNTAASTAELNMVLAARKAEQANSQNARDALGSSLPVRDVSRLPTMDEAAEVYAPPMRIVGTSGVTAPDQLLVPPGADPFAAAIASSAARATEAGSASEPASEPADEPPAANGLGLLPPIDE